MIVCWYYVTTFHRDGKVRVGLMPSYPGERDADAKRLYQTPDVWRLEIHPKSSADPGVAAEYARQQRRAKG